ncbi:MAG TPA: DNA replication and repair protein RecF [Gemmatimonadales bacterium]
MRLERIAVRGFRNLAALDLELPPRGVALIGENGQGKTNLLEAIYYLVLFRSLRGAKDRELVRFGEAGFFVGGTADVRVTAGYEVEGRRKKVTVDGGAEEKLSSAVGRILAVAFSPADRSLVAGGPGERRRYLDVLLALAVPGYLNRLLRLRAALKQRNAALRRARAEEARAFDAPFAEAGEEIRRARAAWVSQWGRRVGELSAALGEREPVKLAYRVHGPASIAAGLAETMERDLRRGMTTVGPHRDDLVLELEGRVLRHFASAGQQRTAAIALRLVEGETLREARGTDPIALYDDVFAELDDDRQERLLTLIERTLPGQAIVTAPRVAELPARLLERERWTVKSGQVTT